jgi:hypothetical protein
MHSVRDGRRVTDEYFPMVGDGRAGGTIYQWVFGWYPSAWTPSNAGLPQFLFPLTAREGPTCADPRLFRTAMPVGSPASNRRPKHRCVPARKPAPGMASKPAEMLLFYTGANSDHLKT